MQKIFLLAVFTCFNLFLFGQDKILLEQAKFKTGNNPEWGQAGYDDSQWTIIAPTHPWEEQGFADYNGYVWYRFHITIPSSLKEKSGWKDSLRIFLSKIDDVDETYLNGTIIGKTGSFPEDPAGYHTAWNKKREYLISTSNPAIQWDKENIIAVKVYDGGGPGGIFDALPFVNMVDQIDKLKMEVQFRKKSTEKIEVLVITENKSNAAIAGTLVVTINDPLTEKPVYHSEKKIRIAAGKSLTTGMAVTTNKRLEILSAFKEAISGKSVRLVEINPYILTPPSPLSPQINGAKILGVRPGSPVLFKIPATGQKPLRYTLSNLPKGLKINTTTGIITGSLEKEGDYKMTCIVRNRLGVAKRTFMIRVGDLLALTPPMGWNSWNCWGLSVSTEKLKKSAQAMISKGLIDHGWTYMNIDDGWEAKSRNEAGEILANEKFPDMKGLGDWLHNQGLKFGIYSSPGPTTCGGYLGSFQHEKQDADAYAKWGVDYLKYDWCSYEDVKDDTSLTAYKKPYKLMQQALRSQKRDIIYSLCQYGMKNVSAWGHEVDGNCWRTTGDITDNWSSLSSIGFSQGRLSQYAKPGRWNDPDMMIIGKLGWGENLHNTRLTPDEQYTHVSLWCLLSAPLLIGCDLSQVDDFTLNLLTNDEVLAIDQDPLGIQAQPMTQTKDYQVWMKKLEDGNFALGVFNLSDTYQEVKVHMNDYGLMGKYIIRDLWRQKNINVQDQILNSFVPPHGVNLYKLILTSKE
jgi:hypothetical protein